MKRVTLTSLYVLGCLSLCLLVIAACSGPQQAASRDLMQLWLDASADGIITVEESEALRVKFEEMQNAPSIDWPATLGTIGGSVLATFLGIRLAPNSMIVGPQEAATLDRQTFGK